MTNIKTWQERKKEKIIGYIIRFFAGLKEIIITPFLIIGGVLIIGASIFAEVINSKCEREEFEK